MAYKSPNGIQHGLGLPPLLSRPPTMNAPLGGMKRLTSSEHFSTSTSDDPSMIGGMPPMPVPQPGIKPERPDINAPPREGEEQTEKKPPFWSKRPYYKVPNKLKKKRQNARLKKILQPKNATMVLHEIKPGVKYSFHEQYSKLSPHLIISSVEVDGKTYLGKGLSRAYAKMNAAETVLKSMLLQKLYKTNYSTKISDSDEAKVKSDSETMEVEAEASETNDTVDDDFPWGSLASFALYKLFSEWETQPSESVTPGGQPDEIGITEPLTTNPPKEIVSKSVVAAAKATAAPMKKVPDNPTERHPVMLLHQLRPGTQFEEVSSSGPPGDVTFTMQVVIDGKTFVGVGKNKKEAKKETAKAALAGAYDIKYD
ncbi:double-stranded RNA-specific editase 1-like [Hetaerina americana]|uniref:double-stranded RNA-specific editase 1-like n=1 Tax=Hetaerina americana TaxID=62018 RepID=UPI003A7F48A0